MFDHCFLIFPQGHRWNKGEDSSAAMACSNIAYRSSTVDRIAVASHRTTLDGKATRREPPGGLNPERSLVRQRSKLPERALFAPQQDHHQQLGVSAVI